MTLKRTRVEEGAASLKLARRLIWGSVALCLLAGILLITSVRIVYHDRSLVTPRFEPSEPLPANTTLRMGSVEVTLSAIIRTSGSQPFFAPEGSEFVLATLKIRNTSDSPIQLSPSLDTYVKDSSGIVSLLATYAYGQPFRAGELLGGELIQGEVAYLVKKDSAPILYIDAPWSGGVLPIRLSES